MDPLSSAAASINGFIRILEVTYQLRAVDEQTADLLDTTRHVNTNIDEARRLRHSKNNLINDYERLWFDSVIADTEKALRGVAQLIEPARVDKSTKFGINLSNKVMWVFRDNPKVRDKHARLTMCHQSLIAVITCLHTKSIGSNIPTLEEKKQEHPPPYDPQLEDLFNWRNRRRRGKSSVNSEGHTAGTSPAKSGSMNSARLKSSDSYRAPSAISAPSEGSYFTGTRGKTQQSSISTLTDYVVSRPMTAASDPRCNTVDTSSSFLSSPLEYPSSAISAAMTSPPLPHHSPQQWLNIQQGYTEGKKSRSSTLPPSYSASQSDYTRSNISEPAAQVPTFDLNKASLAPSDDLLQLDVFNSDHDKNHTSANDAGRRMVYHDASNYPQTLSSSHAHLSAKARDYDSNFDGADGLQVLGETMQQTMEPYPRHNPGITSFSNRDVGPISTLAQPHGMEHSLYNDRSGPPRMSSAAELETNVPAPDHTSERRDSYHPRRGGRSWLMFHANRSDSGQFGG